MDVYLFGAKATAAGLFRALSVLELEKRVKAFLVSDCGKNVSEIWGCPVLRLSDIAGDLSEEEKRSALVYAAVPELVHTDIKGYPSAAIQHTWYVPEKDWELMMSVVEDLYPEYGERFDEVFSAPEFYNYNMLVAKKKVFADYCAWLYPILDRIEELSEPKGRERHDRYTAYMSESLETLYFMANLNNMKIYHTGRLLYT